MSVRTLTATQKLITACAVIAVLASGLIITMLLISKPGGPTGSSRSGPVTLTGKAVCLPHKNQNGPQTQECAYGLLTDDGNYYQLQNTPDDLNFSKRLTVHGTLELSPNTTYTSQGTIVIDTIAPAQ